MRRDEHYRRLRAVQVVTQRHALMLRGADASTTPNQMTASQSRDDINGGFTCPMRPERHTAANAAYCLGVGAVVRWRAPERAMRATVWTSTDSAQEDCRIGRALDHIPATANGMQETDEMMFPAASVCRTIPCPRNAWPALAELTKTQYWDKKDPPELQFRHDMRARAVRLIGPITTCALCVRHQHAGPLPAPSPLIDFRRRSAPLTQIDGLIEAMPGNKFDEESGHALKTTRLRTRRRAQMSWRQTRPFRPVGTG